LPLPIGTPSKFIGKGKTEIEAHKDLNRQLKVANINAARKIKKMRDQSRGLDYATTTLSFDPRPVSAEDRVRIAQMLANPETLVEGQAELYRLQYGETPAETATRRKKEADEAKAKQGAVETAKFLKAHPDFPISAASEQVMKDAFFKAIEGAPEGKEPEWTARNLEIIYDRLVEDGVLTPIQLVPKEAVSEVKTEVSESSTTANTENTRASQEKPPQQVTPAPAQPAANTEGEQGNLRPRGTRFSTMSTEHGQSPVQLSRQAEDAEFRKQAMNMPLDELKRRIRNDKVFAARLNSIKA
jgi:hypothetical protein